MIKEQQDTGESRTHVAQYVSISAAIAPQYPAIIPSASGRMQMHVRAAQLTRMTEELISLNWYTAHRNSLHNSSTTIVNDVAQRNHI